MRVLVTGGAGFIGSNLVRDLIGDARIADVVVFDDFSTGSTRNLDGLALECRAGSILDPDDLRAAARGAAAIIHLAAVPSVPRSLADPRRSHEVNVTGTLNVLEVARQSDIEQVIVASSSSVYGNNPKVLRHELDWTRPLSPYAVSKLATEAYALAYRHSFDLKTLAFRFFNVYGPAQSSGHAYAAVIPKFIEACLQGRPVEIYGTGHQTRDFTYVGTLCGVLRQAVLDGVTDDQPINLAFGTSTSLLELVDLLEQVFGREIERDHRSVRRGDVEASQADNTRMLGHFGQIQPVSLPDGLRRTIEWYSAQ